MIDLELMHVAKTVCGVNVMPVNVGKEQALEAELPDKFMYMSSTVLRNHLTLVLEAIDRKIDGPVEYVRGGLVVLILLPKKTSRMP